MAARGTAAESKPPLVIKLLSLCSKEDECNRPNVLELGDLD
jgi:hypothetical protein